MPVFKCQCCAREATLFVSDTAWPFLRPRCKHHPITLLPKDAKVVGHTQAEAITRAHPEVWGTRIRRDPLPPKTEPATGQAPPTSLLRALHDSGLDDQAITLWLDTPLPAFHGKTPWGLIADNRTPELIAYITVLRLGNVSL